MVHFGDTSYEKYIFGGGKVPPPPAQKNENKTENSAIATTAAAVTNDEINKNNFESNGNSRWDNGLNNKEITTTTTTRDSFTDTSLDKVLEHVSKFRGAHTTTVNFLSDESKALVKLDEGIISFICSTMICASSLLLLREAFCSDILMHMNGYH